MRGFSPLHTHWYYVWIPILTAFVWEGTLLAMLITWLAQGRPRYVTMEGNIAYISDIGADILKPLFIVGCSITAVGFFLTLVVERWLRHKGRLPPNMRKREIVFSVLAILSSVLAGASLILLSVFDTKRYTTVHRLFLLFFMIGVWLTAIFAVAEVRYWRSVRCFCTDYSVPVPVALEGLPVHKEVATCLQNQRNDRSCLDIALGRFRGGDV